MQLPGVPVIYGLRNALFLEKPSAFQYQFAKAAEAQRSHMSDLEHKRLKMKKKTASIEEQEDFPDANESMEDQNSRAQPLEINRRRKGGDIKDKVQFKRKKAKVLVFYHCSPFHCDRFFSPFVAFVCNICFMI